MCNSNNKTYFTNGNEKIIKLLEQMGDTFKIFLAIMCSVSVMLIIGVTLIINISNSGLMYR
jgi:hypothetical protein